MTDATSRNRTGLLNATVANSEEIDLVQLFSSLWKGKWLIALTTTLGIAAGLFTIANTAPTFQADALLQLEERTGSLALPSGLSDMLESDPRSVTEIEILRSRMVLGQAIADQNLDWHIEPRRVPIIGTLLSRYSIPVIESLVPAQYVRPDESITLEQLVVPPVWLNTEIELTILDAERFRLALPNGRIVSGRVGEQIIMEDTGFSIAIGATEAATGRIFDIWQLDDIRAVASLRERLTISERGRGSGILEVRLNEASRPQAARALNAIIQAYTRQNVARSAAEAESSLVFIREQLPIAERTLREAEAALNDFRQTQGTVDLSLETQTILEQITRIEGELAGLQRSEDELRQRYNPAHPTYRALLDERARLEARLAELREQVGTLPETQRHILDLTRAVELAQRIYTELLTRSQEVEVLRASTIGNVRIIDNASTQPNTIAPRKAIILALSLVLGGMIGAGLVLLQYWLKKGIQDGSELEKLGLPVFATINYNKMADTGTRRQGKLPILAIENTADLTIEALRSLRTSLHFGMIDAKTPTLCITSAHPEAGKSFVALNLAIVSAQAGQQVCLVDADMRRGQLRRHFEMPRNQPGLAEVISGNAAVETAMVRGPVDGLSFLPSGRYPPNPSELLMRAEFSRLVAWCAENFDLTIFDAPPALAVTDPVIVARNTGATVFVARHDVTHLGEIEASIKTFSAANLSISGAILNGFDPKKARGGYGYGYRYDYKTRKQ